jgi:hypothetical protein
MAIIGRETIAGTLHADSSGFHIVGSDMCKATIQITQCCVSIATSGDIYYIVDSDGYANNTKDTCFLGFITTMFT